MTEYLNVSAHIKLIKRELCVGDERGERRVFKYAWVVSVVAVGGAVSALVVVVALVFWLQLLQLWLQFLPLLLLCLLLSCLQPLLCHYCYYT